MAFEKQPVVRSEIEKRLSRQANRRNQKGNTTIAQYAAASLVAAAIIAVFLGVPAIMAVIYQGVVM